MKFLFFLFLIIPIFACSNENAELLLNEKMYESCDFKISSNNINNEDVFNLFKCNRSEEAFDLVNKNEKKFSSHDFLDLGLIFLDYGYIDNSFKYFEKSVNMNNVDAIFMLAYVHLISKNHRDLESAKNLLDNLILMRYYKAYILKGDMYLWYDGNKNIENARFNYNKALEYGVNEALCSLGIADVKDKKFNDAKKKLDVCNSNGFHLEAEKGYIWLYYSDSEYLNPEKSKYYIDKILSEYSYPERYLEAMDFYNASGVYHNKELANKYKKIAEDYGLYID